MHTEIVTTGTDAVTTRRGHKRTALMPAERSCKKYKKDSPQLSMPLRAVL
jgi:hypothetical protein